MKALAVLGSNSLVVFFDCDEEFLESIRKEHQAELGLTSEQVEQIAAHQIGIQRTIYDLLHYLHRIFTSCRTKPGHVSVMRKFDGLVYMAMSSTFSEELLAAQLLMLRDFVSMFALPMVMAGSPPHARALAGARMAQLMNTAAELQFEEQPFLVQANEYISNNRQRFEVMLQGAMANVDPNWGCHALLLMGNKVMATYSRPKTFPLRPRDIFLINIILQGMLLPGAVDIWGDDGADPLSTTGETPRSGYRRNNAPSKLLFRSNDYDGLNRSMATSVTESRTGDSPLTVYSQRSSPAAYSSSSDDGSHNIMAATKAPEVPTPREDLSSSPNFETTSDEEGQAATPTSSKSGEFRSSMGANPVAESTPLRLRQFSVAEDLQFHEAMSNSSGQGLPPNIEDPTPEFKTPGLEKPSLRSVERHVVFLRSGPGSYLPYVMHTVEIHPSIALVVISEGVYHQYCELMNIAVKSVVRMMEINEEQDAVDSFRDMAKPHEANSYMAIRGATEQMAADVSINGNYYPLEAPVNGRVAFERATKDLYLFYYTFYNAWCIGPDLGNATIANAMAEDTASTPDLIKATWESYDYDLKKLVKDSGLKIRCVRNDGCLRTRDGLWARLSTNGQFYCEGAAPCICGTCNGVCGPKDGCNCASCKLLFGSVGFGESIASPLSASQERDRREALMRKELEPLRSAVSRLLTTGGRVLDACHDRLRSGLNNVITSIGTNAVQWNRISSSTSDLLKTLQERLGMIILEANRVGRTDEAAKFAGVQKEITENLKSYSDFLVIKLACNITVSTYLDQFPGLIHFIYCNRGSDTMYAPALIPFRKADSKIPLDSVLPPPPTLKALVWEMYTVALAHLRQGYTTIIKRNGDFLFSYFVWFEDATGSRVTPSQGCLQSAMPSEVIGGEFFKALVATWFPQHRPGSITCFELMMVHLSLVPLEYVTSRGHAFVRFLRNQAES